MDKDLQVLRRAVDSEGMAVTSFCCPATCALRDLRSHHPWRRQCEHKTRNRSQLGEVDRCWREGGDALSKNSRRRGRRSIQLQSGERAKGLAG